MLELLLKIWFHGNFSEAAEGRRGQEAKITARLCVDFNRQLLPLLTPPQILKKKEAFYFVLEMELI